MNTNLEREFNLMPISEYTNDEMELIDTEDSEQEIDDVLKKKDISELDKIDAALPEIDLDSSDRELDELAEKAIKSHEELMELANNVEQKYIGEVASVASSMLASAITARTNKIKKKLDMIDLQIKKKLADHKTKIVANGDGEEKQIENGIRMTRAELLAEITKTTSKENNK